MVRLFRGGRGRGSGVPRSLVMPRHMRPHDYESEFIPPYGMPRGRMLRGHPVRPGPPRPHLPPPRMVPPPLPPLPQRHLALPPHQVLHPRDMPIQISRRPHPMRLPVRHPGMPPLMPPMRPGLHGPPLRRPIRPDLPYVRGRGGLLRRGVAVKRLVPSANGRAKKPQKRKEKTEGNFYCDTCDSSWKTPEKLAEHQTEHQVCGRDGCTFTAHPKVILKHVQAQHDSGLYHRIVFTENPDDVAKWIAERKNRFPTKQNLERKEAQASEMMKRGERIPSQGQHFQNRRGDFGTWGNRRQKKNSDVKRVPTTKRERPPAQILNTKSEDGKWRDPDAWRGDLPQFPGTAAFPFIEDTVIKEETHFSDDEYSDDKITINETKQPFVSNILATLMANYGSDITDDEDDDDDTTPQIIGIPALSVVKETQTEPSQNLVTFNHSIKTNNDVKAELSSPVKEEEDSGSDPEECAIAREDKSNIPILNTEEKLKTKLNQTQTTELSKNLVKRPKTPPPIRPYMKRHQLTLLEKLLKNEIRQERNVILQCVHYVVKNNFFGSGNSVINKTGDS